jgi:hypothetical protein
MMPIKKDFSGISDFHPTENEFLAFWIPKAVPTFFLIRINHIIKITRPLESKISFPIIIF